MQVIANVEVVVFEGEDRHQVSHNNGQPNGARRAKMS